MTQGMRIAMKIKIEEHQNRTIEARIRKLRREEESAKKRIDAAMRQTHFVQRMQHQKAKKWLDLESYNR